MSPFNMLRALGRTVLLGVLAMVAAAAAAQDIAGEVEFARGVAVARRGSEAPRIVGKGLQLRQGDRISTAEGASAILRMVDGTRMTVRPNSELVLAHYQFKEDSNDSSMLMELVRGGFRAVTGLINKRNPEGAVVRTSTATIGIRGTDFDARICTTDCGAESAQVRARGVPNAVQASARVVSVEGELSVEDASGQRRRLSEGGSIYPGDMAETGPRGRAVFAFRDDSRMTLGPSTRFRVDNFIFDTENAREGRFIASLLKGTVRALTGLIAKANHRNVSFSTATATIGIRGTGFDLNCSGACAGEPGGDPSASGLQVHTWLGSVGVTPAGKSETHMVQLGQSLMVAPTAAVTPLPAPPRVEGPRPDAVNVPAKLFAAAPVSDNQEGLFVYVRDGDVQVNTRAGETLHLGRGEAGYASNQGQTARPVVVPKFITYDRVPLPTVKNPAAATVLRETARQNANQCKR